MRILFVSVLLIAVGLIGGCGIITAPVSGPAAVASNMNFSLQGPVVDQNDKPLDGVLMSQRLRHRFWTPVRGGAETNESKLRVMDGQYSVSERGATLDLSFTCDGYYHTSYSMSAADWPMVSTPYGAWNMKGVGVLPVVMYAMVPRDEMNLMIYEGRSSDGPHNRPISLEIEKGELRARNSAGDIDPVDVNLPAKVTLRVNGKEGGFVRVEPRFGYAPMQACEAAPESGYEPTLVIDRERLREMRLARGDDIVNGHEYFYFRSDGRYGKGMIAWSSTFARGEKEPRAAEFRYVLFQAREVGDRRLVSRRVISK